MSTFSIKFLINGAGLKPNPEDPFVYRPKGSVTLAALTMGILQSLYQQIRMIPEILPLAFNNNKPLYALVASDETIDAIYREDPQMRADLRAAAAGNSRIGG